MLRSAGQLRPRPLTTCYGHTNADAEANRTTTDANRAHTAQRIEYTLWYFYTHTHTNSLDYICLYTESIKRAAETERDACVIYNTKTV